MFEMKCPGDWNGHYWNDLPRLTLRQDILDSLNHGRSNQRLWTPPGDGDRIQEEVAINDGILKQWTRQDGVLEALIQSLHLPRSNLHQIFSCISCFGQTQDGFATILRGLHLQVQLDSKFVVADGSFKDVHFSGRLQWRLSVRNHQFAKFCIDLKTNSFRPGKVRMRKPHLVLLQDSILDDLQVKFTHS